jgi:nicotinate-nucleotide--dimethylbenzimidazole phosphoribosyltransferase
VSKAGLDRGPRDALVAGEIAEALAAKAKPRGSLGRLEEMAITLCAIRGERLRELRPTVVVAAADHGLAAEGVSAYPSEVTAQMVQAFVAGGAAICVLADHAGARLVVVDCGVGTPIESQPVLSRRIGAATRNACAEPAMTIAQADQAIVDGGELLAELARDGTNIVALGEMGIGNSTSAAAVTAALLAAPAPACCGPGTGLDAAGLARKVAVVERMLERLGRGRRPQQTLAEVGGFEIAFMTGVILAAIEQRMPILLDGFITAAAALTAVAIDARAREILIASHLSPEPGHRLALDALGLEPLLDLGMRLGEGSGAAVALPLLEAAIAILEKMATFSAAGVTDAGR